MTGMPPDYCNGDGAKKNYSDAPTIGSITLTMRAFVYRHLSQWGGQTGGHT